MKEVEHLLVVFTPDEKEVRRSELRRMKPPVPTEAEVEKMRRAAEESAQRVEEIRRRIESERPPN